MTIRITQETKGEAHDKAAVRAVAGDMGLDHEAGDQAAHSVKRTMGRLFGRFQRASGKKS